MRIRSWIVTVAAATGFACPVDKASPFGTAALPGVVPLIAQEGPQAEGDTIALRRSRGQFKYTYRGSEPRNVERFPVGLDPTFMEILAQHPHALAEANRAVKYQYIGPVAAVAAIVFWYRTAIGALDDTRESNASDLPLAVVSTGVLFGSGIPFRSHLKRAVTMFNTGLEAPGPGEPESPLRPASTRLLPNTLRLDPVDRRMKVGWTLRTPPSR